MISAQFNLSAQAEKFGIFEKKLSLGVRSPWVLASIDIIVSVKSLYT